MVLTSQRAVEAIENCVIDFMTHEGQCGFVLFDMYDLTLFLLVKLDAQAVIDI